MALQVRQLVDLLGSLGLIHNSQTRQLVDLTWVSGPYSQQPEEVMNIYNPRTPTERQGIETGESG